MILLSADPDTLRESISFPPILIDSCARDVWLLPWHFIERHIPNGYRRFRDSL